MTGRRISAIVVAAVALVAGAGAAEVGATVLSASVSGGPTMHNSYLYDDVRLSGTNSGTGTVRVALFGPDDETCSQTPVFDRTQAVSGDGYYGDGASAPSPGTYRFLVAYSGDAQNAPASTTCGAADQMLSLTRARPVLATTASGNTSVGSPITDVARITQAAQPTGTLDFQLFGPDDANCSSAPVFTSSVPFDDGDRYVSAPYVPGVPGTYRWTASYVGDQNNEPVSEPCNAVGESVEVLATLAPPPVTPGIVGHPPAIGTAGVAMTIKVSLAGVSGATGFVTFRVFAPGDTGCSGAALAASTKTVLGPGDYVSDSFVPPAPGVYRYVAQYNDGSGRVVGTGCADPAALIPVYAAPVPQPELSKSFTVTPIDGSVYVKSAQTTSASTRAAKKPAIGFVQVKTTSRFPVGSTVDARGGKAQIITATRNGKDQSGRFEGSRFIVRQRTTDRGKVEIDLRPTDAEVRKACKTRSSAKKARAARKKLPPKVIAALHASAKGQFETHGRHSTASVHGTVWQMTERCDGTLTHVTSGVVSVRDLRRHRTVLVRSGKSYLAHAP
jgi:hypothetical protein